jgi:hypothetical protein
MVRIVMKKSCTKTQNTPHSTLKKQRLRGAFALLILILLFPSFLSFAEDEVPLVARELKQEVQNSEGLSIQVQVYMNDETHRQDLYITPSEGGSVSTRGFVYAAARGVSAITERSVTYRLYTGMVLIDVNRELWAISAKSIREAFTLGTLEEQSTKLWKRLVRLR